MTINRRKLIVATIVSAVLLILLFWGAKFTLPDLSDAKPAWLIAVAIAHLLLITGRALSLCALAPEPRRTTSLCWLQLAARHQLLFSILPMGIGDAGFPYLAKRIAGLNASAALRMVAQLRLRDGIFAIIVGTVGLMSVGLPPIYGSIAISLTVPLLWFSDDIAVMLLRFFAALSPSSGILTLLRQATRQDRQMVRARTARIAPAMLVWIASIAAVMAAFRAIGFHIAIGEALLFVSAVNIARVVSISIAGLGVSEAGAAAALVAAGSTIERATSLALIVRPLLLTSTVTLSLFLDLGIARIRLFRDLPDASTL